LSTPNVKCVSARSKNESLLFTSSKKEQKYSFPGYSFPGMESIILPHPQKPPISMHASVPKSEIAAYPWSEPIYKKETLVAIFTSDGEVSFNGNQENFADIIRMGQTMGITVYVLTPRGLNAYGKKEIEGYLLDHHSTRLRWIKAKLPLPHIVYNRIPTRHSENSSEVQAAMHKLQKTFGIHFFNPHFFNKWTLYTQLSSLKELSPLLPDTILLSKTALQTMCKKHATLYLKPIHGKAGIGMIRIYRQNKEYELIVQKKMQRKKKYMVSSFASLWEMIQNLCKKDKYLVQQGISLAQYRRRPFDVRMLIQKNGQGEWKVTGIGIRIAGKRAITTHVPMGGKIENVNKVFKTVFAGKETEKITQIQETGIILAQAIQFKQKRLLGEMSIDLGIDPNGKIWFFEANAKPMKFDEPEIRTRSLRRLLQYCLYLSGYPPATEEMDG
jgi:hypothetical protein